MLRRIILALLIAAAPTLGLAQVRGTSQFDALVVTGAVTSGSVVTSSLKLGTFTLTGVGTTAGTVAAGNDSRIVGATQNSAAAITGGTINGAAIGGTTPAAGAFTTLSATTPIPAASGGTGYGSVSGALDGLFSSTQGAVLYRGAAGWQGLAPGTSGQVLTTNGTGANPSWTTVSGGGSSAVMQPQGRLTLASGAPVMTAAVSAATSVLYTPYTGNLVPLWNGTAFTMTACAETTQALSDTAKSPSAAAASQVYDYFAWNDGGTCRVTRGPAWSAGASAGSNTARGTGAGSSALSRVNGLLTNAVAITNGPAAGYGTYVGTIATDSAGATVSWVYGTAASGGGAAVLNVWNAYNRVAVETQVQDSTASHSYVGAARAWANSTTSRVTLVRGLDEDGTSATMEGVLLAAAADSAGALGVGLDTTTAYTSVKGYGYVATQRWGGTIFASWRGRPGLGVHYFQAIEGGDGSGATFYGAGQSGLSFSGRF